MMFSHVFAPDPKILHFGSTTRPFSREELKEGVQYVGCSKHGKVIIEIQIFSINGDTPPHLDDHR